MINTLLDDLDHDRRLFFCLLCCERLYPNYEKFVLETKWGNTTPLKDGIKLLNQYFEGKVDLNDVKNIANTIANVTPDTQDFSTVLVSFALDSCSAVYESLTYVISKDVRKVYDISSFAFDTVDMFIQEKEAMIYGDSDFEDRISNDPYMIAEKKLQENQLILLKEGLDNNKRTLLKIENLKTPIIDFSIFSS